MGLPFWLVGPSCRCRGCDRSGGVCAGVKNLGGPVSFLVPALPLGFRLQSGPSLLTGWNITFKAAASHQLAEAQGFVEGLVEDREEVGAGAFLPRVWLHASARVDVLNRGLDRIRFGAIGPRSRSQSLPPLRFPVAAIGIASHRRGGVADDRWEQTAEHIAGAAAAASGTEGTSGGLPGPDKQHTEGAVDMAQAGKAGQQLDGETFEVECNRRTRQTKSMVCWMPRWLMK
jgi:hypothetical protein